MTIKELKEKIANLPDHMDVYVTERTTDFTFGLTNTATVQKVDFREEPNGRVMASDTALVLSED